MMEVVKKRKNPILKWINSWEQHLHARKVNEKVQREWQKNREMTCIILGFWIYSAEQLDRRETRVPLEHY